MASSSAPTHTVASIENKTERPRRISNETACSSNSSCVLQKRKQLHPLAAGPAHRTTIKPHAPQNKNSSGSTVKQRVLSAKYLRFKTLQNELNDANFHIAQLINENKLLKSLQKRQDHALSRYEGTNAEIPKMIESHQEEVRVLQLKIKGLRKNVRELNDNVKAKDDELNLLKDQNRHLMNLCKSKNLEEREKLSKKVEELEATIRQQDTTISTLNRRVAVETKNNKFKLAAEVQRNRTLTKELLMARSQIEQLTANTPQEKDSITERRTSRNASTDRKLLKKISSSTDRKKDTHSTSSLVMSDENESSELTLKNGLVKNGLSSISEDQLKNIVENWQKKNAQDSLSANMNDYALDIIQEAQQVSIQVQQHTSDYKKSEKELESLLSTLKETDEVNSKLRPITSPVLDFTEMFKKKDKNANVIKMKSEERVVKIEPHERRIDNEMSVERRERREEQEQLSVERNSSKDKMSFRSSDSDENENPLVDFVNLSVDEKDLLSNESSSCDLALISNSISNFSKKVESVERTASEDKERLLAKLKAIDNGIDFESQKQSNQILIENQNQAKVPKRKTKDDLIKELFG